MEKRCGIFLYAANLKDNTKILSSNGSGGKIIVNFTSVGVTQRQFVCCKPTWCTMSDWTCLFSTCMRAVVTTERTSGTTISLRMSLMSRWFLWKRAAAVCFTEKPSS